jgi:hypothetical protein
MTQTAMDSGMRNNQAPLGHVAKSWAMTLIACARRVSNRLDEKGRPGHIWAQRTAGRHIVRCMRKLLGSCMVLIWLAVGSPAVAAQHTIDDAHGDVLHGMDIQWVHVRNAKHWLYLTTKFRSIPRNPPDAFSGVYIDVTPGNGSVPDYLITGGIGAGYSFIILDGGWLKFLAYPRCSYHESIDYGRDVTLFSVSRGCLNGASFEAHGVRVSAIGGMSGRHTDWAPGRRSYSRWIAWH